MKNNKLISLLLSIFMSFTCFTTFVPVLAEKDSAIDDTSSNTDSNGMHVAKTAVKNDDDTYTIRLEAYATGSKVITEVSKDVPTDIVLVLDQSGSMEEKMTTYSFRPYTDKTNSDYYSYRSNNGKNNLYFKQTDGSYASVSVSIVNQEMKVDKTLDIKNCYNNSSEDNKTNLWENRDSLYVLVNGEYEEVTVSREKKWSWDIYDYIYYYTYSVGNTVIATGEGKDNEPVWVNSNITDNNKFYIRSIDSSKNVYSYTYTDATGKQITIGNSTGDEKKPEFELYERYSTGNITRLEALKNAVTTFTDSVAEKAKGKDGKPGTDDDINHRIAVVGFATGNYTNNANYPKYENTELFIGSTQYNYNNSSTSNYYKSAFQDLNTEQGYKNVIASKDALAARGATYINYGMQMAENIFKANTTNENRNKVVIVFTDGVPGYSGYDSDVADKAVEISDNLKKEGVTVYSVGIFSGADATSAGNSSGDDTKRANYFMQKLSSNNGKVQNPSYYLSASDSASLSTIFKQISENIESGGSTTTLNSEAVVKDIISPQFELPERTTASNITVETYKCIGEDSNGYTWEKNDDAMGATASINDDQVSVTGFDFAKNYVGTITEGDSEPKYIGNELVIKFTVKPKEGFLGGNNVFTNVSADIYENSSATKPVVTFNRPQVNVPIKDISITPSDKNVYLLGSLTGEQLKEHSIVKCGNVTLDLTNEDNYGLKSWQTDYVNVTTTVKDSNGDTVTDRISDLKGDTIYSIEVTISPKYDGIGASGDPAKQQSKLVQGNINVYKPFVTVSDSIAYYGDTAPTDFSSNRTIDWKHGDNVADITNMGKAPDLSLTYIPFGTGVISNGTINTKNDIPVSITAKINTTDITSNTSFMHECTCGYTDCDKPENGEFWIHVKTCNLTISKKGGSDDETYVFKIKKDGSDYTEVSITGNGTVTIDELPVGKYTVEEDTAWSWRYPNPTITYSGTNQSATLSSSKSSDEAVVTNNRTLQYWLNGFSDVVRNVFGTPKN